MGSRAAVQNKATGGEAVDAGGKENKGAAADGRNRRVLGDIGNLVNIQNIRRPITRAYCAQLLANAQAAAENDKPKVDCVALDGGAAVDGLENRNSRKGGAVVGGRAMQKKDTRKPPLPEKVIEISPDMAKEVKKHKSPKKKKTAFTSVLSSRSKAACGVRNDKPKVLIEDIDAGDVNNELAAVEYVEDIYQYYKDAENESQIRDYMRSQPEISERVRAILVDWLIQVHQTFELTTEVLYLTINILDRFLSTTRVARVELQLVGIGAMLIASKYEEIWCPEVNDFVLISERAGCTHEKILQMEKTILRELEWTLTVPTPFVFLARFIKASLSDQEMENMVYFLAELGMMNYEIVRLCPSMIAASAVYAARCTLNKVPVWTDTLKLHTGFSEQQLMSCAKLLVGCHSTAAAEKKMGVVYKKYITPERLTVALLPPAKTLLATTAS